MLDRLLTATLASVLILAAGSPSFAYYSKDSYEGDVTFNGMVEIPGDTPDSQIRSS